MEQGVTNTDADGTGLFAGEAWFDPIEAGNRVEPSPKKLLLRALAGERTEPALDTVNARYGRGTLRPLATGIARSWSTRHDRLSQRYTTRVEEMLTATAW